MHQLHEFEQRSQKEAAQCDLYVAWHYLFIYFLLHQSRLSSLFCLRCLHLNDTQIVLNRSLWELLNAINAFAFPWFCSCVCDDDDDDDDDEDDEDDDDGLMKLELNATECRCKLEKRTRWLDESDPRFVIIECEQ